ncbi:hypothetical protein HG536_0C01890 [Torulaspora globosa]|uniref:Securin n=1 Tax=Torulaspora globosa TaxID=48254 RepID=A0A7G3ZET5_9SACH|nr:uncharacterized protein HG536_0C01890 [Torulaspora globosa]QLL32021.1 hypothetical protein HG536_0C01890 [Torulaspora globosa]
MPGNENKENDLVIEPEPGSTVSFPQTPAHLLKRSVSTVFKQPNVDDSEKPDLSNAACDAPIKNISPLRRACAQQGRLPLASKDNNRASSFGLQQQQQQPLLKRDNSLYKKRKPFERVPLGPNEQLLANPRRLKKYGSVLGYNSLPKMKSLVLKDVGQSEEQEDNDEDDDEDDSVLRLKLRDALNNSDGAKEVGGLFGKTGGLQQLIRDSKREEEDFEDREIEYCPPKHDPLPYVPDGHVPLLKEDIEKLTTFRSPYLIEDECSKSSEDTEGGFLDLEDIESGQEDEEMSDASEYTGKTHVDAISGRTTLELEPRYAGEGLSASELNDLVGD